MPRETREFSIETLSILDESGKVDRSLMPALSEHEIKSLYEAMVLTRLVDDRILKLQREGRCGTYGSSLGHEATQVGSAFALKDTDWMFPYFRELGAHLVRKFPASMYMLYWMGDERGMKVPEHLNDFMIAIPVATQVLHATGAAFALKYKKTGAAAMVYMGDGATSEGDFHEGMNFGGAWQLPIVYVCQNNQYAISLPVSKQTAAQTMAQKAIAYGFPGIRVDGNDVFAVFVAAQQALERARAGKGPTFIECLTYRLGDHTTSDDAGRYRTKEEVDAWKRKEPIERLRKYMEHEGIWTQDYESYVQKECAERVDMAVKEAEGKEPQTIDDLFAYTYAVMTPRLREQLQEAKDAAQSAGGE